MATPFLAYMHCDVWDLLDEGIDAVLDRVVGEIGVDGISVSAVTPPVHVFRPHAGVSPHTFRCEAGAHFQPDAKRYAGTRLRPIPCGYVRSRNPLEQIARACEKRNLRLRLRVNVCNSPTLVERYPFAGCKDVFGDPSPARLCPSNPDVQAYLRALVDDLAANYQPECIDLDEADFGRAEDFHPGRSQPRGAAWHSTVICFCESCRQRSGAAEIAVHSLAERIAANPSSNHPADHDWIQLERQRVDSVTALLRGSAPGNGVEYWYVMHKADPHRGVDAPAIATIVSGVVTSSPIAADSGRTVRRCEVGGDAEFVGHAAEIVSILTHDVRTGLRRVVFESHGTLPIEGFDAIRQAIRFARREAGS